MKTALIGIVAAACLGTAANSAPILVSANVYPVAHVSYADLNLASSEGRARLEGRISAASEDLCTATADRTVEEHLSARTCYEDAVASGLRQMNGAVQQQASASSAMHRDAGE